MLVYPNITKKYNEITKDSYIVLIPEVIKALMKINGKIHFTILTPIYLNELGESSSIEQRIYNERFSNNNNTMRTSFFFDAGIFMDALDYQRNDYDIIYSHLPEHTLQLSNLIQNQTHSVPKIFGYCHWFELGNKSVKKMLLQNYVGMLEMEKCGVNSQWLKDNVMKDAKKYFNDKTLKKLDEIIQPHHLGIDDYDFTPVKHKGKKTIIYNYRGQAYMGWKPFQLAMDKLWKKRKDFRVVTFQKDANAEQYEWAENEPPKNFPNRDDYLNYMKENGYIGVGWFEGRSGGMSWSICVTDGLSKGVPFVLPDNGVYPQMVGEDYPLLYKNRNQDSFIETIESALDKPKLYKKTQKHLESVVKKMKWLTAVKTWMDWKSFFNPESFPMVSETDRYKQFVNEIKKAGRIDKVQLVKNWGVQFKFGKYRNRLRLDKRIKFTKNHYEWIG